MKRIIKEIKGQGIVQITVADERWYVKKVGDVIKEAPSVTWITQYAPMSEGLIRWYGMLGNDRAKLLMKEAGERGSKVHQGIEMLLSGETIEMNSKLINPDTTEEEEISLDEYECLMSFVDFYTLIKSKVKTIMLETVIFNDHYNFGGTVDWVFYLTEDVKIPRQILRKGIYVTDFKTSKSIQLAHQLQISAYGQTISKDKRVQAIAKKLKVKGLKLAVLQIGYRKNRLGWKFTPVSNQFQLFLKAKAFWKQDNPNAKPKKKDYPVKLKIISKPEGKVDSLKTKTK